MLLAVMFTLPEKSDFTPRVVAVAESLNSETVRTK